MDRMVPLVEYKVDRNMHWVRYKVEMMVPKLSIKWTGMYPGLETRMCFVLGIM